MENLKIGTIVFGRDSFYQAGYTLAININNVVYVRKLYCKDKDEKYLVPSGWPLKDVLNKSSLCIDADKNWYVHPTQEAWDELLTLKR